MQPISMQYDPFSDSSSESDDDNFFVSPWINNPSTSAAGTAIMNASDSSTSSRRSAYSSRDELATSISKENNEKSKNEEKGPNRGNGLPGNSEYVDTYTTCPIFRPTVEEFKDLGKYLGKLSKILEYEGFCKVIPPRELYSWNITVDEVARDWTKYNKAEDAEEIPRGQGRMGCFVVKQSEEKKDVEETIVEEEVVVEEEEVIIGEGEAVEVISEKVIEAKEEIQQQQQLLLQEESKNENENELMVRNPIQQCVIVAKQPGVFTVANVQKHDVPFSKYMRIARKFGRTKVTPNSTTSQQQQQPKSGSDITQENDASEEKVYSEDDEFFDPHQVERDFWKTLTITKTAPLYGSDVPGSLASFPGVPFTMDDLPCALKDAGIDLPGITKPMLYIGMWRSMFAFHTEDLNLPSINIVHAGQPKMWYGVPPSVGKRLESLAQSFWPGEYLECDQFLRHKTKLISPQKLKQNGVPFYRAVQYPGEIMITWPGCYHGGFNAGLNIAEAVNFLPPPMARKFIRKWGKKAKVCKCRPDSVKIDMRWFHHVLPPREKKRKMKNVKRGRKAVAVVAASASATSNKKGISYPIPSIQELNNKFTPKTTDTISYQPAAKSAKTNHDVKVESVPANPAPAPVASSEQNDGNAVPPAFSLFREDLFSFAPDGNQQ